MLSSPSYLHLKKGRAQEIHPTACFVSESKMLPLHLQEFIFKYDLVLIKVTPHRQRLQPRACPSWYPSEARQVFDKFTKVQNSPQCCITQPAQRIPYNTQVRYVCNACHRISEWCEYRKVFAKQKSTLWFTYSFISVWLSPLFLSSPPG